MDLAPGLFKCTSEARISQLCSRNYDMTAFMCFWSERAKNMNAITTLGNVRHIIRDNVNYFLFHLDTLINVVTLTLAINVISVCCSNVRLMLIWVPRSLRAAAYAGENNFWEQTMIFMGTNEEMRSDFERRWWLALGYAGRMIGPHADSGREINSRPPFTIGCKCNRISVFAHEL